MSGRQEAPATEEFRPFSGLCQRALERARLDFDREIGAILQMEAQDRSIPQGARVDLERGVFVLPAAE